MPSDSPLLYMLGGSGTARLSSGMRRGSPLSSLSSLVSGSGSGRGLKHWPRKSWGPSSSPVLSSTVKPSAQPSRTSVSRQRCPHSGFRVKGATADWNRLWALLRASRSFRVHALGPAPPLPSWACAVMRTNGLGHRCLGNRFAALSSCTHTMRPCCPALRLRRMRAICRRSRPARGASSRESPSSSSESSWASRRDCSACAFMRSTPACRALRLPRRPL
mmetsp:Transcript_6255/g.13810  ORF Transcript_6255/g.13810 Transcript_6255/m.13810 type:complete len:219 (-) Transcript_6255:1303-1959(-)